jgi:AcrR family transcriptional regulator
MMPTGQPEPPPGLDMIWLRPSERPQAKPPPLSLDQIVRTAIELADEGGLDAASMRQIAAKLGAGTTSLYWRVKNKSDLYELMFDGAYGDVDFIEPTGDWRADLRALARTRREVLQRHPWLVELGIQPGIGPNVRRFGDIGMSIFAGLGLDRQTCTEVLAVLNNYLTGFAHRESSWAQLRRRAGLSEDEWQQRLDDYLEQMREVDPGNAVDIENRMRLASDHSFELGLNCVLAGIDQLFISEAEGGER